MSSFKVTFHPEGKEVYVLAQSKIFEAAAQVGLILRMPCGGQARCGKCRVKVLAGRFPPTALEKKLLNEQELKSGIRLACQSEVVDSGVIQILQPSYLSPPKLSRRKLLSPPPPMSGISKQYFYLNFPSTQLSQKAKSEKLKEAIGKKGLKFDFPSLQKLPQVLREGNNKITGVFSGKELIAVEEGDTTSTSYGIAFDIGTTTLAASLMDLTTGEELGTLARINPQVAYGDELISRLNFIKRRPDGLETLHRCLKSEMNQMIASLAREHRINPEQIYQGVVVGNSVIEHVFLKISPLSLASLPFSLPVKEAVEIKARDLGININKGGNLFIFPNIGAFVGGDAIGVILATEIYKSKEIKLIIDIGTNGEIILGNREKLLVTSTAAGPAFEGLHISCGLPAQKGAIEKVVFTPKVEVNVIGNQAPQGISGVALIDTIAEMLNHGVLSSDGEFQTPPKLPGKKISPQLLPHLIEVNGQKAFLLVKPEESNLKKPIFITQGDIREFQLAKAAISSGIKILKKKLGIKNEDIAEVLLAGTFGNFIRRENAARVGLFPPVLLSKVKFIGNAALQGAKLALTSRFLRRQAFRVSSRAEHVELAREHDFTQIFAEEMLFP
jgi:uncharacterized 2Fe-2S/4Fe-4S cluster protein (DUF4445 family)